MGGGWQVVELFQVSDVDRSEKNFKDAQFDLFLGIILSPLELVGARAGLKALRESFDKIGNVKDKLLLCTKLDREVKGILSNRNITD